jgi:hypothetical protein
MERKKGGGRIEGLWGKNGGRIMEEDELRGKNGRGKN